MPATPSRLTPWASAMFLASGLTNYLAPPLVDGAAAAAAGVAGAAGAAGVGAAYYAGAASGALAGAAPASSGE